MMSKVAIIYAVFLSNYYFKATQIKMTVSYYDSLIRKSY